MGMRTRHFDAAFDAMRLQAFHIAPLINAMILTKKWAYYNEIDPFAAQWIRNLIKAGHVAPGHGVTKYVSACFLLCLQLYFQR